MIRRLLVFAAGAALAHAHLFAGGVGFPRPDADKTLRADFKTPPPGYGQVPFWWWSGREALNKERLREQIEELLPALFTDFGPDTAKVRLDMNDVMSALACERYYKPIYEWHASRGLIYGCDQALRGKHPMNKYIDYMRTMKYFTAPRV